MLPRLSVLYLQIGKDNIKGDIMETGLDDTEWIDLVQWSGGIVNKVALLRNVTSLYFLIVYVGTRMYRHPMNCSGATN